MSTVITSIKLSEPGQTSIQYLNGVLADVFGCQPYSILPVDPDTKKTFVTYNGSTFQVVGNDSLQEVKTDQTGNVVLGEQ
jgi:hypothetical protein